MVSGGYLLCNKNVLTLCSQYSMSINIPIPCVFLILYFLASCLISQGFYHCSHSQVYTYLDWFLFLNGIDHQVLYQIFWLKGRFPFTTVIQVYPYLGLQCRLYISVCSHTDLQAIHETSLVFFYLCQLIKGSPSKGRRCELKGSQENLSQLLIQGTWALNLLKPHFIYAMPIL